MLYKVSRLYARCPDELENVCMNWKVSGQYNKCPDNLESVSGLSKKSVDYKEMCLNNLESARMIRKVSG